MPRVSSLDPLLKDSVDSSDLLILFDVTAQQDEPLHKLSIDDLYGSLERLYNLRGIQAGTGVTIELDSGTDKNAISIGQEVETTSNVTFNDVQAGGALGVTGNSTLSGDLGVTGNTTLSGNLDVTGNSILDGNLNVGGNLFVDGTTTTLNSTELTINDINIIIGDSAPDSAAVDGGGITLAGANAKIYYDASTDEWVFNKDVNAPNLNFALYSSTDFDSDFNVRTTDDLPEGTNNKYFSTTGAAVNTDALPEGSTNLYLNGAGTTDDLTEGDSNQYYTNARVDSDITSRLTVSFSIFDSIGDPILTLYGSEIGAPGA